MTETKPDAH